MMTYEKIEEVVQEVLEKDVLCRPRSTFSLDDHLTNNLRIDTDDLSFIFARELEHRLGVDVPVHEWSRVGTGRDAAKLLYKYLERSRSQ